MAIDSWSTSNYLSLNSAPAAALPLTMACRFYSTSAAATQTLMTLTDPSAVEVAYRILLRGDRAGDPLHARMLDSVGGGNRTWQTTAGYSINTWQTAVCVFITTTDCLAYINGDSTGGFVNNNTVSITPTEYRIGTTEGSGGPNQPIVGRLADCAVWNVALTAAEVVAFDKGVSPLLIRPASLVHYRDLIRQLNRPYVGATMTENGTLTVANHPPVRGNYRRAIGRPTVAVGGADVRRHIIPAYMRINA